MLERGMIFNAEMVRAILDGRKTQTRRPVRFPVLDKNLGCELAGNELAGELSAGNYLNSAFGKPGDRIWVRETFRVHSRATDVATLVYKASVRNSGRSKPTACLYRSAINRQRLRSGRHRCTCRAGPAAFCWKLPVCAWSD